ncbi:MAG TPA: PRC-barrel domain-containing protein, partial [Prolixibacteraceae bacterium]|nr:PRC-barrel domain-containing protein [Prolixibacteraceae bacterium]
DVTGWEVCDANNDKVGKVSGLLVDPKKERVVYLDVDVNDNLISESHDPFDAQHHDGVHEYQDKKGDIHMIVPVGVAHLDKEHKTVVSDGIDMGALRNFPSYRYRKGTPIHPDYERKVLDETRRQKKYTETEDGRLIDRDLNEDNYYESDHFNQDRFYGRSRTTTQDTT